MLYRFERWEIQPSQHKESQALVVDFFLVSCTALFYLSSVFERGIRHCLGEGGLVIAYADTSDFSLVA